MLLFVATGIHLSVRGKFFQITKCKDVFKHFIKSLTKKNNADSISQFSTFCSVLGACIGTGNIVGVATAISSGGPGVVFWMILSAILSMAIAYTENYLGAEYTVKYGYDKKTIGAFAYIEKGLKMKKTSKAYALFCLASVFGMGNVTQSNSIAEALKITFDVPLMVTGFALSVVTFIAIKGGIKRIARLQTFLVPAATIFFLFISLWVITVHKANVLSAIKLIIAQAFTIKAVRGFNIYTALRYGVARGVFSNEAGLGSSTILHAQAEAVTGKTQGICAMLEVFADTIFMCTITALVIVSSMDFNKSGLFGVSLSLSAYSTIGKIGKYGISILTVVFSFTSLVSCSFYGEKSLQYLLGNKSIRIYKIIYIIIALLGCINPPKIIWALADICNGLMAIPNLFAINILSKEVDYSVRT